MHNRQRCRVVVLAFADARKDARTLNVCRTLAAECELALWNTAQGHSPAWQWHAVAVPQQKRMLVRWLWFVVALCWRVHRWRADIIWAGDVYCLLPAVVLRWRWKARVVYDAREIYSSLGSLAERRLAQKLLAWYERWLVRWVDRIVTSGQRDAEELATMLPLRAEPEVVLNVPFYTEPVRSNRLRERCRIEHGALVVLYQGAVHRGRGLIRAVEVIATLEKAHLCILGDGDFAPAVERHAYACGVAARVHLLGSVPYDELLDWTASADVGWCWIEPISHSYELALPNKLFEYAMARVPVLASDLPAIRRVLEEFPFGVCCAPTADAAALAAAITHLHTHADDYRTHAERAAREYCYERQQPHVRRFVLELWQNR
ncbi:MAG: glycosyltransferase [Chlorobiota bacterium]|nr:MAG: glycosyltransferase [Chlorobiota bacterium]